MSLIFLKNWLLLHLGSNESEGRILSASRTLTKLPPKVAFKRLLSLVLLVFWTAKRCCWIFSLSPPKSSFPLEQARCGFFPTQNRRRIFSGRGPNNVIFFLLVDPSSDLWGFHILSWVQKNRFYSGSCIYLTSFWCLKGHPVGLYIGLAVTISNHEDLQYTSIKSINSDFQVLLLFLKEKN